MQNKINYCTQTDSLMGLGGGGQRNAYIFLFFLQLEEYNQGPVMKTTSIATIIICNTFKSIETGLTSGKLQILLTAPSTDSLPVAQNCLVGYESGTVRLSLASSSLPTYNKYVIGNR